MGKRSDFDRIGKDYYITPYQGVIPLLPFLCERTRFYEPCAGDGALVRHLKEAKDCVCVGQSDIDPKADNITTKDALEITGHDVFNAEFIITNPPWDRKLLHPMIDHFRSLKPTWLLFDADWMHTKQSIPYMKYCKKVVSVGRLKWFPDSNMTGKDNSAWYLFTNKIPDKTVFIGRT